MKKLVLGLLLLGALSTSAQQLPDFTLYNNNMLLINPAYAGIDDGISIATSYRKQWLGINGAPSALTFAAHGYIPGFKVGAGVMGWQYEFGAFKQTAINTDYSYRLDLGFAHLNFGLQVGILHYRSNYAGADLNGIDDPAFFTDVNETKFNWGGGVFLFADKYYAGISAPTLATYEDNENATVKIDRHFFITGGYLFDLNENFLLKPHALIRMISSNPTTINVGLTAYYRDYFGLGIMYKSQKIVAFSVDLNFNKSFFIGYSYDLPGANDINTAENGSHEFSLHYILPWNKEEAGMKYY